MTLPNPDPFPTESHPVPPPSPSTIDDAPRGERPASDSLPSVPGYEVLSVLGRGGMGVVYRAVQLRLNRIVALKMILAGGHASREEMGRFRREAEAIAHLKHPNIVHIYEVDDHDGLPYFSLEFIEGQSLRERISGNPLPPREAAELVKELADAMEHAHENGIVHRDLKPANVLLATNEQLRDHEDSVSGSGSLAGLTPKITDFGLAKRLDTESKDTQTGQVMGTPAYMAPEQARGDTKAIGPLVDVYALGAILYECLTGRPPFLGATKQETMEQVVHHEPIPPRALLPTVPRDLDTICLKCLQKEPGRRYESADELAQDLGRFLRSEPIEARPVGALERAGKWVRRQPVVAGLIAAVVIAVLGGFALFAYEYQQAVDASMTALVKKKEAEDESNKKEAALKAKSEALEKANLATKEAKEREVAERTAKDEERKAKEQETRAKEEERKAKLAAQTALARESEALANLEKSNTDLKKTTGELQKTTDALTIKTKEQADTLTAQARALTASRVSQAFRFWQDNNLDGALALLDKCPVETRRWDWYYTRKLCDGALFTIPVAERDPIVSAEFTPGGKYIHLTTENRIGILEARTGRILVMSPRQTKDGPVSLHFLSDGKRMLVVAGAKAKIRLVEDDDGEGAAFEGHEKPITSAAFSPDEKYLLTTSQDGTIRVWKTEDGEQQVSYVGSQGVFAPDGKRMAVVGTDGAIRIWNVPGWKDVHVLAAPAAARVATGTVGLVGATQNPVAAAALLQAQQLASPTVGTIAFSPDGKRLALRDSDPERVWLWVWDVADGKLAATVRSRSLRSPEPPRFTPDSQRLVVDGQVIDIATGRELGAWVLEPGSRSFDPSDRPVFSPDGRYAVTKAAGMIRGWQGGNDRNSVFLLWDTETARETAMPAGADVNFSPDGERMGRGSPFLAALRDRNATFRTVTESAWNNRITTARFSPDGQHLAVGSSHGSIHIWDMRSRKQTKVFRGHGLDVHSLSFSPDGRWLLSASRDQSLKWWDLSGGQDVVAFPARRSLIFAPPFAFSATAPFLAAFDKDGVQIRDVRTGEVTRTVPLHGDHLALSPDGTRLLIGNASEVSAVMYDLRTGRELFRVPLQPVKASKAPGDVPEGRDFLARGLVAFSPDGKQFAVAQPDNEILVCDAGTGEPQKRLKKHLVGIQALAFSPDGQFLASCAVDGAAIIWDLAKGQPQRELQGILLGGAIGRQALHLAYSPDGKLLAVARGDTGIRLHDTQDGRVVHLLTGHSGLVTSVAFSPDGQRLVSVSRDGTVRLWDVPTGLEIFALRERESQPLNAAFSPDGRYLAVGLQDGRIEIHDSNFAVHRFYFEIPGETALVAVALSRDGKKVSAKTKAGTVATWDLTTEARLAEPEKMPADAKAEDRWGDGQRVAYIDFGQVIVHVSPTPAERERRLVRTQPDPDWHVREAEASEKAGAWFGAAFHLERLTETRPDDLSVLRRLALSHAALGRTADYRAACERMLERFGKMPDYNSLGLPFQAPTANPLVMLGALELTKLPRNRELTGRTVVARPGVLDPKRLETLAEGITDPGVKGALLVRAGKHEDAVRLLADAREAWPLLWLALAEQSRGRLGEARAALAKAQAWLAAPEHALDPDRTNGRALPPDRALEVELLRREVESLLR